MVAVSAERNAGRPGRSHKRGVSAVEFALIAPTVIVMFVGILEVWLRFQAAEQTERYTYQVADLLSRDDALTTDEVTDLYNASIHMMKPLTSLSDLDVDVRSIGFADDGFVTPFQMWRRSMGAEVPFDLADADGLASADESVIHVGVRYHYSSPLGLLFGESAISVVRGAYSRPRVVRQISMDGALIESIAAASQAVSIANVGTCDATGACRAS